MSRFLVVALTVSLLVSCVSAGSFCIGMPASLSAGAVCGSSTVNCKSGLYCDATATCVPLLAVGSPCQQQGDCVFGAQCQGPFPNSTICVALSALGGTCQSPSPSNSNVTAMCISAMNCNSTTYTCQGGSYGDKCTNNLECNSWNCTSGACGAVPDGGNCGTATEICGPQSYCDPTNPAGSVCTPRMTAGACNTALYSTDCAPGYYCTGRFSGDTAQCIQAGTIAAGQYCTQSDVCVSPNRCDPTLELCSSARHQYCTTDVDCGVGQKCTCNGLTSTFTNFVGVCTNNPCHSLEIAYSQCFDKNCQACTGGLYTPNSGSVCGTAELPYAGTCGNTNCLTEYTAMIACDGAGQLAVSLLFTSLIAFVAFFFSKEF